jgi:hypothetical protein
LTGRTSPASTGNYQTLMAANGVFATLASRQLA